MLLKIHPQNPSPRYIQKIVDILGDGGLIVYPTDTVYGLGCDIFNTRAVERVARIKGIKPKDANFSFICHDFSHLSDYTRPIGSKVFKLLSKNLPGPFTFVLPASNNVPKLFKNKKKTVGIRIPDHPIILEIVKNFGHPIVTTSIHDDDRVVDYTTDPELIHEKFKTLVDAVIDGGYGKNIPSTVVDCTGDEPEIVRQGLGELRL
jgi:tRNA threonylcarbamoyl adenosine modification protein (Sua5/YciO/YrdC/YwlC family)